MQPNPFTVNWEDLKSVIAYGRELSKQTKRGLVVIKWNGRNSYNITFEDSVKRTSTLYTIVKRL